jgi:deoxyribonuclease-4
VNLAKRVLLGAHQSIAGGVEKSLERGQQAGCETIQIFVKSPNRWQSKPLAEENIAAFRQAVIHTGIDPVFAHAQYLVNLATPDDALWQKSISALADDHMGSGEESGIARIAAALDEVHRRLPGYQVQIWLEITAGQGDHLGYTFEQLRDMIAAVHAPERLGICFDTAHAFAAGYELRSPEGSAATWLEFERVLGLDRLRAVHLNDSKKELGSRVDRHEHIGQGLLGLEAFRLLLNDPRFFGLPMTLETDKGPDLAEDRENLALLRSLIHSRD